MIRDFIWSSVACQPVSYFSTLYHKRYDLGTKIIEHDMCALIFSAKFLFFGNSSHSKKN